MAIGAVTRILVLRLEEGGRVQPSATVPEMLRMAVRPYVGEEAAREELHAPRPRPRRDSGGPESGGSVQ
jgi:hypothetical protein